MRLEFRNARTARLRGHGWPGLRALYDAIVDEPLPKQWLALLGSADFSPVQVAGEGQARLDSKDDA